MGGGTVIGDDSDATDQNDRDELVACLGNTEVCAYARQPFIDGSPNEEDMQHMLQHATSCPNCAVSFGRYLTGAPIRKADDRDGT